MVLLFYRKNPLAAVLSNYEVLKITNEMKLASSNTNQESSKLATIIYEVLDVRQFTIFNFRSKF